MYKIFYKLLSGLSILAVTIFSIIAIIDYHEQMFAGSSGKISLIQAKLDVKDDIERIAKDYNVLIAKQIMVKSTDGKSGNKPTFQTFGKGTLPRNFEKQTSKTLIDSSPDDVLYFIFGENLSDQKLVELLNEKGNQALIYRPVWQLIGINAIMTPSIALGLFLILLALSSLLFAEKVSALKQVGIERLSGMSIRKIAFRGTKPLLLFNVLCGLTMSVLGYLYLLSIQLANGLYLQIIITTVFLWIILISLSNFIVMCVMYLVLKNQPIQKVIKGYAPAKSLAILILFIQFLSVTCLVFSIETMLNSRIEIASLNKAEANWKKVPKWFSPSFMGGASTKSFDGEKLFNFLDAAQKNETFIIAADNLNYAQEDNILPDKNSNSNVIYVSPTFLTEQHIVSDLTGTEFPEKSAWILIPKSKSNRQKEVTTSWEGILTQNLNKDGISIEPHNLNIQSAVYDDSQPIFNYRILGSTTMNNKVFSNSPVLLVVDINTYAHTESFTSYFTTWLSQQKLIFSDPELTTSLIEQYELQDSIGSYTNGLFSVQSAISNEKQTQLYLSVSALISTVTSLILLAILNNIYFYQNRRQFTIKRLAGLSKLSIHWRYLLALFLIMLSVGCIIMILQLNLLLELVPLIIFVLMVGLFYVQLSKNNKNLLNDLKGE